MEQAIDIEVPARSRMLYANIAQIEAQPVSEVPGDTEGEAGAGSTGVSSRSVRNACTQKLQAAIRFVNHCYFVVFAVPTKTDYDIFCLNYIV